MGIYPDTTFEIDRKTGTLTRTVTEPGLTRVTVYVPIVEIKHRDDCYCCSCGEHDGSDPACRNHGWAAQRPCEVHGMPGQPWSEEAGTANVGQMPYSVQVERARLDRRANPLIE